MKMLRQMFAAVLVMGMAVVTITGCGIATSGAVKDDTTLTGTSKQLATGSDVGRASAVGRESVNG